MLYLVAYRHIQERFYQSNGEKKEGLWRETDREGRDKKKPDSWKCILANEDNKRQIVKFMLDVWSNDSIATKLHGREVIFICEGFEYSLKSDSG